MDPSVEEIRRREEQNQQPTPEPDTGDGSDPIDSAISSRSSGLPIPNLSRQQVLVLAGVVAIGAALLYLRRRDGGATTQVRPGDGRPQASVAVTDEQTGHTFEVPQNPDEELDKDRAIVQDSGIFEGNGGDE